MRALRLSLVLFAMSLVTIASAQEKKKDMPGGVQGSFLKQSMFVEKQFVSLVEATPQEKFSWRPAEGVRSIAESFLHVALGNYTVVSVITGKQPEGIDTKTLEKSTTDKAKIVEAIKKSFAHINDAMKNVPEKDYSREVDFFGNKMTVLDMIFIGATHQHETIGQSIAYARTNGVVPPWTEERMKAQQQKKAN